MVKVRLNSSQTKDVFGGFGNINILRQHVEYFEKKTIKEVELGDNFITHTYLECPNFAAWLRLYAEYTCNKALRDLSRAEECSKRISEYTFGEAVEKILELTLQESSAMKRALKLVIELRHTLQHGGVPNILREVRFDDVDERDIRGMLDPQNYVETRKVFLLANKLIDLLPSPTLHG